MAKLPALAPRLSEHVMELTGDNTKSVRAIWRRRLAAKAANVDFRIKGVPGRQMIHPLPREHGRRAREPLSKNQNVGAHSSSILHPKFSSAKRLMRRKFRIHLAHVRA